MNGVVVRYTQKDGDVVVVKPPVPLTEQAFERMLGELVRHLRQAEPYGLVFDLTSAEMPSALQRRKLSEHLRVNQEAIRQNVRGLAVVATSAALRGVTTAVFWVFPPPVEWRTFDLVEDAKRWAQSRCVSVAASL
jgi:hypothetical protein